MSACWNAHLAILAELRSQGTPPRLKVRLDERIQRVDANPLIRHLHWLLQRAHHIDSIEVHAVSQEANPIASMRVIVLGTVDQIDCPPAGEPATTWHLGTGKCTFELEVACEPKTAKEKRAA